MTSCNKLGHPERHFTAYFVYNVILQQFQRHSQKTLTFLIVWVSLRSLCVPLGPYIFPLGPYIFDLMPNFEPSSDHN